MRGKFLLLFLVLFISFAVSKPTITFQNDEVRIGETAIAKIEVNGSFTRQIEDYQVKFFDGRKEVFIEFDLDYFNETHYLSIYASRKGDFDMSISEVLYSDGESLKSYDINIPLSIVDNKVEFDNDSFYESLSIRPGFYSGIDEPSIKLINTGTRKLNVSYFDNTITLMPFETKEVVFIPSSNFSLFYVSSYKDFFIPILYFSSNNQTYVAPKEPDLRVGVSLIVANLFTDNESNQTIQLFNFGEENITDISFNSSLDFLIIDGISDIPAKGVINISLLFNPTEAKYFGGEINFSYFQYGLDGLIMLPYNIYVLPTGSNISNFNISFQNETCEGLGGSFCGDLICKGEARFTESRELCCLGVCEEFVFNSDDGGGSFGWIIGILILLAIVGVGYYFYKKSKNVGPSRPEDALKQSTDKISKRIKPSPPTKVSKGLIRN